MILVFKPMEYSHTYCFQKNIDPSLYNTATLWDSRISTYIENYMGLTSLTSYHSSCHSFADWFLAPAMFLHAVVLPSCLAAMQLAIFIETLFVLCKLESGEEV